MIYRDILTLDDPIFPSEILLESDSGIGLGAGFPQPLLKAKAIYQPEKTTFFSTISAASGND